MQARLLLNGAPFPDIALLENPANPVVRFETSLGAIDIELFADAAPGSLENFLPYLLGGRIQGGFPSPSRLDGLTFHRVVPGQAVHVGVVGYATTVEPPTLVLDGTRRFASSGPGQTSSIVVLNDTALERLEWTVSLHDVWIDHPTAPTLLTWLSFNLTDNPVDPATDMPENALFHHSRVIGRIIPGESRDNVSAIASLPTVDATGAPVGTAFRFLVGDVPVLDAAGHTPGEVPAQALAVTLRDAELIKAAGAEVFFDHRLYYPEGFAGDAISEFVPITNPNGEAAHYQLIARFETGERDMVIASGVIGANSRGGVTISRAADPAGSLVPWGRAYALELQSTLPLAATLSHYDFGSATGEAFTSDPRTEWFFADALVAQDFFSFLVWHNTSDADGQVQISFYHETPEFGLLPITVTTSALRRGGLSLGELPFLIDGRYGVRIVSDQPIVAALSQYDNRNGAAAASTEMGVHAAAFVGALPMGRLDTGEGQIITLFNPADPSIEHLVDPTAIVTLTFTPADETRASISLSFEIGAGRIVRQDAGELAETLGTGPFTVRFDASRVIVARAAHATGADVGANPFAVYAAHEWHFAEGFMDPSRAGADVFETLAVYNTVGLPTVQNDVTITFRFTDGTSISEVFSLSQDRHLHLTLHDFAPLLEQAAAGRNFYSIQVTAQFAVVAMMWHDDLTLGADTPTGRFATLGDPFGEPTELGEPLIPIVF